MMAVKRLYRSKDDRIISGVCGGIAKYMRVDPVVVRLIWAVAALVSMGMGVLAYLIAWILIPEEPSGKQKS